MKNDASSFRMIRMLGVVSLLCGVLIVITKLNTFDRIRHNQETIMQESVAQLLPGIEKQVIYGILPSGELKVLPGLEGEGSRLFAGYDGNGSFLGVVGETSERGYGSDPILAMYAYSPDKKAITGFKIVESHETPGLGSRIGSDEKFTENFKELDASHPIQTVKHGAKKNPWEIDAISGATISSRAVGRMLQKSVKDVAPVIARNMDRIRRGN